MGRRPTRIENAALLSVGGIGYGALLFVWFSLPAYLGPIIDALGLSGTQAGVLAGAIPLTYIPLGLLSGLVIDRVGARVGIGAGVTLAGLGQLGRASAPDFPSMLAFTLLMGVGATGLTFGLPKLAAELYPTELVGRAASVYLVASYAGSASTFALGRPVIGPALGGWRPLFLASGAATVALAVAWALLAWAIPAGSHEIDGSGDFALGSLTDDVRAVFSHRDLRLLVVLGTMYLFINHGLQGWLVTLFEARGVDPSLAGGVTAILVAGQVVGVLAIPAIAERMDRTRGAVIACGCGAGIGVGGLFFEPSIAVLLAAPVAIVGIGMGGLAPLIRAIPAELDGIGPALTGTAVGLVFAVGEIGGFLGPVVIGALRDATGSFAPGLSLVLAATLVAAGAGAAMDEL
ncbi:MAG: MFS transporter [Natronomonas sp.]|jgi:cyanate permease|uniref:MFS transporter n=1 Tax=Natronomonas sp. TaxID=2184060 RepID=UPI00286FFB12|nr:MFS transporter [Natronomonas sp.]MDR9430259.1 MFS transporter [Natronomonas sp.]